MNAHEGFARLLTALGALALLSGCTTPPMPAGNVIPREGGLYQVISNGKSEQAALQSALSSAESTCKARGRQHIVVEHRTEYKGLGTEGAAQTIEKIRRIILESSGQRSTEIAGDEDYKVTMQFRCESSNR